MTAFNMVASLAFIRDKVAEVTALKDVFSPSETDDNKIPEALDNLPAVIVLNGPTTDYKLSGQQSRTYKVRIQIFAGEGDSGDRAATVLPIVDAILEKFVTNVRLGGLVTSCTFKEDTGLVGLEYPPGGGMFLTGEELIFEVIEHAAATPAP